ncbi:MAG: DUF2092 domain-containing protein, partial [Candidatus Acidiferrum sp.]
LGDGPPSEFYYDGKMMMAYAPTENLVAVSDAPPTLDETMEVAYHIAAIYFPFDDVIVSDPYKDISDDLRNAFYIGQSNVVGGTTTDMIAYDTGGVFIEIWIGADDKLPRMLRAIYGDDPQHLRHRLELSNWRIDPNVTANAAVAAANANAAAANANAAAAYANYTMGEIVPAIPAGCATPVVNGITYYLCGNTWFSAAYGANGVYYRVVTTP